MTILVLSNSGRGLLLFRKQLLVKLMSLGYEIAVSAPDGEGLDELGIRFYKTELSRRGKNPISDFMLFRRYKQLIAQTNPVAVLTYTVKPNVYGALAAKSAKLPYFINVTGLGSGFETSPLLRFIVIFLYRISANKAKILFFQNSENKAVFDKYHIGTNCKRYVTCGSGVDFSKFDFLPLKSGEKTEFLFMGRLMKEKGIFELFEAAKKLYEQNVPFHLTILGKKEENIDVPTVDYISHEGEKTDVLPYIEAAHCVILPSYHEGMSNALLEGAACGRALIASDVAGAKEAVVENLNGYLVKKGDASDLAEKMKRFAVLPTDKKAEMGKNSNVLAKERFDRRLVTDAVSGLIHACLTGKQN